ncbi:MAG TPA: hypothetical protein VGQ33_22860 [Vicinamibacteria bacterium]|nr:hypothetical protein [Vicinamibacteria bacterium]
MTERLPKAIGFPDRPSAPLVFLIVLSLAAFLTALATGRTPEPSSRSGSSAATRPLDR